MAINASQTHAIISFVVSGHVVILDAATRTIVFAVDVGAQAHVAVPALDESYILVANQNGKLLQRINTNYTTNTFTLDGAATLNLAVGLTPSGAAKQAAGVRPDTAPIYSLPDISGNIAFITLRGGGLFVVDPRATPMGIVGEYTITTVEAFGLLAIQKGNKMYFNSGMGSAVYQGIQYRLPVNAFSTTPLLTPDVPAPVVVFDHGARPVADTHGLVLTRFDRYLWVADRAANLMTVVDTITDTALGDFSLVGPPSADPAPDLLALAPGGQRVYVSLRGPNPLTQNFPPLNNAVGSTPGLGVILVAGGGVTGVLSTVFPISNVDSGSVQRADPHAIAVRLV